MVVLVADIQYFKIKSKLQIWIVNNLWKLKQMTDCFPLLTAACLLLQPNQVKT